ncbi:MAG TPA: VOC family protein [Chitinophagaceae bacterium]|jgi:catechol-2,3-dioxygenase|nr:VOC family protein [Chitinophagaceae bacterium]
MQIAIPIISLSVNHLQSTAAWYEQVFGWHAQQHDADTIVFKTEGFVLLLIDQKKFDRETFQWTEENPVNRFSLAISVDSREEVDERFEILSAKKVTIIRSLFTDGNNNYKGLIADPEGNFIEIGCFPFLRKPMSNVQYSMFNAHLNIEH